MKLLVVVVLLVMAFAIFSGKGKRGTGGKTETPRAKALLTKNEQPMYFRLLGAFPDAVVLAQVSFSALITARTKAVRNRFDRKVADFVLCTRAFEVIAVIELDDSSHKGKEAADRARDSLLTEAGYRVLRYTRTPDIEQIRSDIGKTPILRAPLKGATVGPSDAF